MADIVNLRTVRKRKTRAEKGHAAAENRIRHGRSGAERNIVKAQRQRERCALDDHRREAGDDEAR